MRRSRHPANRTSTCGLARRPRSRDFGRLPAIKSYELTTWVRVWAPRGTGRWPGDGRDVRGGDDLRWSDGPTAWPVAIRSIEGRDQRSGAAGEEREHGACLVSVPVTRARAACSALSAV